MIFKLAILGFLISNYDCVSIVLEFQFKKKVRGYV